MTSAPANIMMKRGIMPANDQTHRTRRQFFDEAQGNYRGAARRGQAAIEYVLLVAITSLIFGAVFYAIRGSVFRLWVCDLAPRVESPAGCDFNNRACYKESAEQSSNMASVCAQVAP